MLAIYVALFSEHAPLTIWQQLDIHHAVAAIDFCAQLARSRRHGVGDVGRGYVPVSHRAEGGL